MSNMSSSAFAESPRIPHPTEMSSLLREHFRTQSFATFRYSASRRSGSPSPHKQRHSEIDWQSIAGMRNVLVHDYFEVDFETVWLVVTRDLPPLEKAMRAILAVLDKQR